MRVRSVLLLASVAGLSMSPCARPRTAYAQTDLTAMRAAVERDPDDHRARCRLAYNLMHDGAFAEARDTATVAIERLQTAEDRPSRRVLGACLYNRGRAFEGLGEIRRAVRDYADSVTARPNDTVAARLRRLVPATPSEAPLASLAIVESGLNSEDAEVDFARLRGRDDTAWTMVTVGPGGSGNGAASAYAVARACNETQVRQIDEIRYDNATHLRISAARARRLGEVHAIVVNTSGGGDDNCGTTEGMADYSHEAVAVVFLEECQIRVVRVALDSEDCGGTRRARVRFDRQGNVVVSQPEGAGQPSAGSHSLRELAR